MMPGLKGSVVPMLLLLLSTVVIVTHSYQGRPDCGARPVTGPCRAYIPRYFFNRATGRCEQFVYGGCQGNSNSFTSARECWWWCGNQVW